MRDALKPGYHAVRGSTPTFDHEQIAREIVDAFKRGKRGVNFRNASPYVVSGYRGKKIYYCAMTNDCWGMGEKALADNLREILAPEGYENQALAGHDQYYDLACEVARLVRKEILA